jgi:hypothetical protein
LPFTLTIDGAAIDCVWSPHKLVNINAKTELDGRTDTTSFVSIRIIFSKRKLRIRRLEFFLWFIGDCFYRQLI